jgi:hypothetical protein
VSLFKPGRPSRISSRGVVVKVNNSFQTLYTCPNNCLAEVTMLYIVNANGNASPTVVWERASDSAVFTILGGKNFNQGDSTLLTGATLVLEPGDILKCKTTNNNTPEMDFMCTVIETFIPIG